MNKDTIFQIQVRKCYRSFISVKEIIFGITLVGTLLIIGGGIFIKAINYDNSKRDVSIELIQSSRIDKPLYQAPFKPWNSAGTALSQQKFETEKYPASIIGNGWSLESSVKKYDASNLYEKINGQAEQYIEFGLIDMHFAELTNGNDGIDIELYDLGNFANAVGLFADNHQEKDVIEAGENKYFLTSIGAVGISGQYFYKIVGRQISDATSFKANALISSINSLNTQTSPDAGRGIYGIFRKLLIPSELIKYVKEDAFQYSFADNFWFAQLAQDTTTTYFLHQAKSAANAAELFNKLVEVFKNDSTKTASTNNQVSFRHKFLKTYTTITQDLNLVYGLTDYSEKTEIALLEKIEKVVDEIKRQ